jgi:type VI secretion system protein ImpK
MNTDTIVVSLPGMSRKLASDLPPLDVGSNPLIRAANALLNLIPQLRVMATHPDPEALRDYLVNEVKRFEAAARASGAASDTVVGARYCLCTALDETAAQTPWGGSGVWSRHSLLVTFHNETWGGEKFFQLLSRLAQNPQQHRDLLEMMYYCIALGFEGRYRIIEGGRSQLDTLMQRLVAILKTARGEYGKALSTHWKGVVPEVKRAWAYVPLWLVGAIAGVIALLIYLMFAFWLADRSDALFAAIGRLRLPAMSAPAPPQPAAPRFAKFLEPEIREGLVTVRDEADRSTVILRGDGLFEPGSIVVLDRYLPVLSRIADALNQIDGPVVVTGYTDNVPIRTVRFPSNWQLSQARANAVKAMLLSKLKKTDRVRAEGRGEADPAAANDSPVNRARNRRVEITLLVPPNDRDAQLLGNK